MDIPPPPMLTEKDKKKLEKRKTRKGGRTKQEEWELMGFTDTFTRLQHEQPPIIDTMEVQPGVDLESQGKVKKGPKAEPLKDQMSRADYQEFIASEYQTS